MKRDAALWFGVLGPPFAWALVNTAKFMLAYYFCIYNWKLAAYLVSFIGVVVTVWAGWTAWSQWQESGRELAGEQGGQLGRTRAMAFSGLILSGGFLIVMVATTLPELLLQGCE